jgi:putative hydrolase of HD superfamily
MGKSNNREFIMETKSQMTIDELIFAEIEPTARAWIEISQLKNLYRRGWLQAGIPAERCESVAEHSFGVAILCSLLLPEFSPQLNVERVLRMALLHDIGEVYAGDITPQDGLSEHTKRTAERESVTRILGNLPAGQEYLQIWEEFETGETPEARFVRQVDKLEMGLQARIYAEQGYRDIDQFYRSAVQALSDSKLQDLVTDVIPTAEAAEQGRE